jgi:hypothetical protein
MDRSFDIFYVVAAGDIQWIESVTSLEIAKIRISDLGRGLPGKYLILGKPSGERTVVVIEAKSKQNNG